MDVLEAPASAGCLGQPLPSPRDDAITALLDQANENGQLAELARPQRTAVLGAFAERMAALAIRTGDPATLRNGLLAAVLAVAAADTRDAPAGPGTARTNSNSTRPRSSAPRQFTERGPEDQRIEAMGYVESAGDAGFRHLRIW
jgi:hypothetical protein